MDENRVDNSNELGYNVNNDENEIVVDTNFVPPINDVECKHETLVADPTDTIGDAVYHGCANPKCGRGWYIRSMK